ncbi:MAG: NAD-dependent epimerase/dehydratase family protein [Patulibacter sp.]|nr:NAD-dependent epimerase/dehydratase family protein [Patulibacter sp.]
MHIFLTGGSGFVGGRLIARFVADGHTVHALARSDASATLVEARGAAAVRGDLDDLQHGRSGAWTEVLGACDAVVHAAAYMEFWGSDRIFEERNLGPTIALHAAATAAGVRRVVLLSAAAVSSGSQRAPVVDEQTDDGRPNLAYSRVKLATEQALLAAPSEVTSTIVLRPPFIWGPQMSSLDDIVGAAQGGRFAWVDGGRHTIDFVHVDNLARATVLALGGGRPGGIYYVTDGTPRSARDFIGALLETQAVAIPSRSVPRAVATVAAGAMEAVTKLARRSTPPPLTLWLVAWLGRDRSYDISLARRELGYEPTVSLEEGLREMRDARAA